MKQQRGGTILGFIIGVVVGLGAALAVAVYVTKVPIPFINKGQSRSADQDVAESQRNKNWDPNAPLYGKNPAKPVEPAKAETQTGADTGAGAAPVQVPAPAPAPTAKGKEIKPAVSADPLGDLAQARAGAAVAEPFSYFVQIGAFRTAEDAESQRARLSLGGVQAKVSEREQSGRTVFRVRVGPFGKKEEADQAKEKLDAAGYDTALVRVAR
ncbi:Sporulation related [Rhodoferax ferrireducens T118]|uniref:Sporulation related n=1 Tax=Albidiferax ferrireducens (strain ATCC BAA-621 / DSM 15236 / T118) TaxID=338969 RepID=Q220M9_ALBFT|nr:SPOR domain-containing protein [Rhodoferax ferrireducens]ABD68524.1 Sporulation related [Rhodoferax ferrireducens T118]